MTDDRGLLTLCWVPGMLQGLCKGFSYDKALIELFRMV
jgi:hypothetical protein